MEDSKVFQFFKKHSSKLLYVLCGCVALGIFVDRKLSSKTALHKHDYNTLRHMVSRCLSGEPLSIETTEEVAAILNRHPELHPTYDSLMALALLGQENTVASRAYTNTILERTKSFAPTLCRTFTETTLLIVEERFEEALKASLALEEEFKKGTELTRLRAFNLWRIASLAEELGQSELHAQMIEAFKASPAFPALSSLFQEKEFSLEAYLSS